MQMVSLVKKQTTRAQTHTSHSYSHSHSHGIRIQYCNVLQLQVFTLETMSEKRVSHATQRSAAHGALEGVVRVAVDHRAGPTGRREQVHLVDRLERRLRTQWTSRVLSTARSLVP